MLKHFILTTVIATMVAVFGPHNPRELGTLVAGAGVFILRLGLLLDPPGYDAGWDDPSPAKPSTERA